MSQDLEIVFSEDRYVENEFEERKLHIAENEGDRKPVVRTRSSHNGRGSTEEASDGL